MRVRRSVVLLCLVVGAAGWAGATVAPSAEMTVDRSQTIPQQEISFENEQFRTAAVTIADPGETITADVSISPDEVYRVYVYDTDENIVDSKRGTADASFDFELDAANYPPGTYMLAVVQDGDYLAIHPLVVRGYQASVDAPADAEQGSTLRVSASVTHLRGEALDHVEFVATNGEDRVRQRATEQSDGSYVADVALSGLAPGEYEVYATVRDSEAAFGENEFLGVNDGHALTIQPAASPTPTDDSPPDGGDGTDTPTVTPSATQTATVTPTDESSPTDDSILTPDETTQSPTQTDGQAGFGPVVGLAAMVALVGLLVRD